MDIVQIRRKIEMICQAREQIIIQGEMNKERTAEQYLVLPMLELLGYQTMGFSGSPIEVIPQFSVDAKMGTQKGPSCTVDYAVCIQTGKPCIFVEVKSLAVKIDAKDYVKQLASYFHQCCESVLLGILTNGQDYRLFVKKRDQTGKMDTERPILACSIDELLRDDEKRDLFLKYAHKDNMIKWREDNGESLLKAAEDQDERSRLFDCAQKLLAPDGELDPEFIKCMLGKCKIDVKKGKGNGVKPYEPKVREALNRAVKKIQNDCLRLAEEARNNNADGVCAETKLPDVSKAAPVIPDNQESADIAAEKASNIVPTGLELQILEKLQAIVDASDLPKKLWSKTLNQYIPTQIKYKDTTQYINYFIDDRSQEEINASGKSHITPIIRYGGQNKIQKGQFYFNVKSPDELKDLLPVGFEISPPSTLPVSNNKYPSIAVQSFEDIDKLAPIFVRCLKKAIDEFIAKNPVA